MAGPDAVTVEVEFTPGVWTDLTQWVDFSQPGTIHFGRATPFDTPQPGALSGLVLDNTDGRFTPLRQTLADGITAHPYWPNVVPRKRIRVAYVVRRCSTPGNRASRSRRPRTTTGCLMCRCWARSHSKRPWTIPSTTGR
jgi:hypothetical protein